MIQNGEGRPYLIVKKLSVLLRGMTSKHHGYFYCLNCLQQKTTWILVSENKDFCNVLMLSEETKILEFNQYQKSGKAPFTAYADFECLK